MHAALPFALALLATLSGPAGAQTGLSQSASQAVCQHLLSQLSGAALELPAARCQRASPAALSPALHAGLESGDLQYRLDRCQPPACPSPACLACRPTRAP